MVSSKINNKYIEIESLIKEKISTQPQNDISNSIIQSVVNEIFAMTNDSFEHVFLQSIAILIDDFFHITFPEDKDFAVWDTYAFLNEGIIGDHCKRSVEEKIYIFTFPTKQDLVDYANLPQRGQFAVSQISSFFISPIIIYNKIIGSIQLSFDCEFTASNDEKLQAIKEYLIWLNHQIEWIIYAEYLRLNGIVEKANFLVQALDSVDEYQSYHSICVSKLAKIFGYIINKQKSTYKSSLIESNPNFNGANLFKLQLAGLLHDTGKINMWSFEDFNTELEWRKRQLHPFFSYTTLNRCGLPNDITEITGNHHESINNQGEPFALNLQDEEYSIESQIIKFVDIVDSSIRERDKSKERSSSDCRDSFDVALDAVRYNRDKFSLNVYLILYSILRDINDKNLDSRFNELFNYINYLLGIERIPKNKISVNSATILNTVLNDYLNSLDLNKWLVLFVFQCDNIGALLDKDGLIYVENIKIDVEEQREKKYSFLPTLLANNLYLGVYSEDSNKEYAYSFCESFDCFIGVDNSLACAFLSHRIIHLDDFQNILDECINTLHTTCMHMPAKNRWRLLRFDINKIKWK